jgi:molybdopterin synthase catalytic subunit
MRHLTRDPLDPAALAAEIQGAGDGAVAMFVGVVRDHNQGLPVRKILYTAYEEMAELEIEKIIAEIAAEIPEARVAVMHRLGELAVGVPSVAVAAVSPHRDEAFRACREAIDRVKARAPIWKKES